jgi:hypothetical protein
MKFRRMEETIVNNDTFRKLALRSVSSERRRLTINSTAQSVKVLNAVFFRRTTILHGYRKFLECISKSTNLEKTSI